MTNESAVTDDMRAVQRWENEGGQVSLKGVWASLENGLVRRNNYLRKRRDRKFAWIFGASAIVIALLYWEQAAALYVLSTVAMCAVLLVVAFSNLEARDKELHQAALENTVAREEESSHSAAAKKKVA